MNKAVRTLADALRVGAVPPWLITTSIPTLQSIGDDILGAIGAAEIVDAIEDDMMAMAKDVQPLEPGQFRSIARAWEIISEQAYDDNDTVSTVRDVLVAYGALGPDDHETNIVTLLELLLPPTLPSTT